jgi:UDP-2,3-diacylglucosamine pyrophosphatase LpxH
MSATFFDLPVRKVTVVISDLHIGGGENDLGDDHIGHGKPLIRFFVELPKLVNANPKDILLVINGDFFEFAQTAPEKFDDTISYGSWCCESESLDKAKVIIEGNKAIWKAMKEFQRLGGCIVIAVGNHDIDFTWPKVRDAFTEEAGYEPYKYANDVNEEITTSSSLVYALGKDWLACYDRKLLIAHGNQYDPANKFNNWHNPIQYGLGPDRLEMCAGTMFMIKFVNPMEKKYPFADNIIPVTRLYGILRQDAPQEWKNMLWLLGTFVVRHPFHTVGEQAGTGSYALDKWFNRYTTNATFKSNIDKAVMDASKQSRKLPQDWDKNYESFNIALTILFALMPKDQWVDLFVQDKGTLGGLIPAAIADDMKELSDQAKRALRIYNAKIVVMGHTHQPDEANFEEGQYFNPGSWTRYWDISKKPEIKLGDLEKESNFPFQLNFIEIRHETDGIVKGLKRCFEDSNKPYEYV